MDENTKKRKKRRNPLTALVLKLLVFAIAVWVVFAFVLGWKRAPDNDMFPMIKAGDFCLFYKLDKAFLEDPIVYEDDDGNLKIGRIVAIEGQEVDFPKEGGYVVDGTTPSEYLTYETKKAENGKVRYPITVGKDEYFVLNDHREDVDDSRTFGPIPASRVKGRIIFILRRRSI
jgi:signal peptidase I